MASGIERREKKVATTLSIAESPKKPRQPCLIVSLVTTCDDRHLITENPTRRPGYMLAGERSLLAVRNGHGLGGRASIASS